MATEKNSLNQKLKKYTEEVQNGMPLTTIPRQTSTRKRLVLVCFAFGMSILVPLGVAHAPWYALITLLITTLITMWVMWKKEPENEGTG